MSNAVTLDKGLNAQFLIAPPPTSATLDGITPDGTFKDITALVTGFKYWESITQLFVQAEIEILDGSGKINNIFQPSDKCGIRKYCAVQVILPDPMGNTAAFDSLGRIVDTLEFSGTNTFYVSQILEQVKRDKKDYYKLRLFTKNAIINAHKRVIKSYSGRIDTIVSDVVSADLKSAKTLSSETGENTQPIRKYLAQNIRISDIIDFACQKSQSLSETTSSTTTVVTATSVETKSVGYTFYEDYDNFHFRPLYKLIKPSSVPITASNTYDYLPRQPGNEGASAAQKVHAISFNRGDKTADAFTDAATGATGVTRVKVRDVITNAYSIKASIPIIKNPCDVYKFEGDTSGVQYWNVEVSESQLQFVNECTDDGNNNKTPMDKKSYDAILEYIRNNTATATVPGNMSLRAGDYIGINIGVSETESSEQYEPKHQLFLITSLCHRLTDVNKVYTDLELYGIREL